VNPLIVTHFQLDAANKVSLPTLNEELSELNAPDVARQRSVRDEIAGAAYDIRRVSAPIVARIESEAREESETATRIARLEAELAAVRPPPSMKKESEKLVKEPEKVSQVQILDPSAFAQNVNSNLVYQQLKEPRATPSAAARSLPRPPVPVPATKPVEIRLSDLEWRNVSIDGRETLAALRAVHTPEGMLIQGWLTPLVDGAVLDGATIGRKGTLIGNTGWHASLPQRFLAADSERERFTRTFASVAAVLMLVVAGVVWTLTRTQRLATDRARFAATAAHELRTPLASLRLYSDLIADEGSAEKRESYAREIAGQTERLGRVVANVLEVTRLERGTFALKPREGRIESLVEECVARLRPQLEAADCRVDFDVAPSLPRVTFDADAMHHVVGNLIDNAEKFSRDSPDRSITVAVAPSPGGVTITVSDRGPGVPEDFLRNPRPYRRAASSSSTAGLGLGLFLVHKIVRGHGGEIRSEAREGGGATIRVFLPALNAAT
jgi:signal transduction histidine kinase